MQLTCGVDRMKTSWIVDAANPQRPGRRHVDLGVVDGHVQPRGEHHLHLLVSCVKKIEKNKNRH